MQNLLIGTIASCLISTAALADGWFLKVPVGSHHEATDWFYSQYDFTEFNPGVGIGYEWEDVHLGIVGGTDIAFSAVSFIDSFSCDSTALQVRVTKPTGPLGLGASLNYANKCLNPWHGTETVLFPTLSAVLDVTDRMRVTADYLPIIPGMSTVAVVGFSIEIDL